MKTMRVVMAAVLVGLPVLAQAGKAPAFKTYSDLNAAFDKAQEDATKKVNTDKLAALEAFIATAKDVSMDDMNEARITAAELASELNKHDVALKHAEKLVNENKSQEKVLAARVIAGKALAATNAAAEKVTAMLNPVIEGASLSEQESVRPALDAAEVLSDYYVEQGKKDDAKKLWTTMGEKLQHPQLSAMFDSSKANVDLIGEAPKAFKVKDLKGQDLDLAQFKGKVTMIDFWATWCGPCVAELPNVIANYKKYNKLGFEIIGISLDNEKDKEKLEKFIASHDMPWRQFFDGQGWKNEVATLYGIHSIPATYLLDREGKVYRVGLRGEALGKALEKLLAAKK